MLQTLTIQSLMLTAPMARLHQVFNRSGLLVTSTMEKKPEEEPPSMNMLKSESATGLRRAAHWCR